MILVHKCIGILNTKNVSTALKLTHQLRPRNFVTGQNKEKG